MGYWLFLLYSKNITGNYAIYDGWNKLKLSRNFFEIANYLKDDEKDNILR